LLGVRDSLTDQTDVTVLGVRQILRDALQGTPHAFLPSQVRRQSDGFRGDGLCIEGP
jgi:hypothetical protein